MNVLQDAVKTPEKCLIETHCNERMALRCHCNGIEPRCLKCTESVRRYRRLNSPPTYCELMFAVSPDSNSSISS